MANDPMRAVDIKQHNQKMILSMMYDRRNKGGISQSEIVQQTGLKAPSVFRIFSALENEGFIRLLEGDNGNNLSKKGRKPSYFTVCSNIRYVIGLEFWASCISIGVFNFNGERIHSSSMKLSLEITAEMVIDKICVMVEGAINLLDLPKEKIFGLGVAAPGKVKVGEGKVVYYARIKGMVDFPLQKLLNERLGMSVFVHNNCSAMAYYEYCYDNKMKESIFSFLLRAGVNGTFVNNNQIYLTGDNMTLEAGHLPLNFEGPECVCGLKGCLQAYLIELDKEYGDLNDGLTIFSSLVKSLESKDKKAISIMDRACLYFYDAMKVIVRVFSPKKFFFITMDEVVGEYISKGVSKLFIQNKDNFQSYIPEITYRKYNGILAQQGASDLVLRNVFNS